MSNIQARHNSALLHLSVESLVDQHGRWRVAFAAMAAAFRQRRRQRPQSAALLDNHLRVDIGLPPIVDPPGMYWNVRW